MNKSQVLNKEVWLSLIQEKFYPEHSFLNEVLDLSEFVSNDVINLAEAGVNPNVPKNNTTYPVPASTRTDTAISLTLAYYDTESTIVRNAEQAELSYDKMARIVYGHKRDLLLRQCNEAAHAYAPARDTLETPIVRANGARSNGYHKITYDDIKLLANRFDKAKIPRAGRIILFDTEAQVQLREEDRNLFNQMMGFGKDTSSSYIYGFKVYAYHNLPYYNASNVKKAYGSAIEAEDKYTRAIAFQKEEVMKAVGSLDMFYRLSDEEARGDILGFSQRFLALPVRDRGLGAIIT